MAYLSLIEPSSASNLTVIHAKSISHLNNMAPKRLEKLDLSRALRKIGMHEIVRRVVKKTDANKNMRMHDRGDVILGAISAIAVGARKTRSLSELAGELRGKIGIKSFPERSTLSRLWRRLDKPLYEVFLELSSGAIKLSGKKVSFGRIIALDVKGVLSKCRISKRGFIKGRVARGLKIHLETINGVPARVFFHDASSHDTYYVDDFLKDIGRCDHVVADRAFFDLELMAKLSKRGVSFTTRTKGSVKFHFVDEFVDGSILVKRYIRIIDGVRIWRYKGVSTLDNKTVFDITTTLKDYKFALTLYALRWDIEVVFRHLSNMRFRLLGYSYHGFVSSVLLFLIVYLLAIIYAALSRRRKSISEMLEKFERWFRRVCCGHKPP